MSNIVRVDVVCPKSFVGVESSEEEEAVVEGIDHVEEATVEADDGVDISSPPPAPPPPPRSAAGTVAPAPRSFVTTTTAGRVVIVREKVDDAHEQDVLTKVAAENKTNLVGSPATDLPLVYVPEVGQKVLLSVANAANGRLREYFFEPHGTLPPGTTVRLRGLATRPEWNGRFATVIEEDLGNETLTVSLAGHVDRGGYARSQDFRSAHALSQTSPRSPRHRRPTFT